MKTSELRYLQKEQLFEIVGELLKNIGLAYGLKEPASEFISYFANVAKKYYGYLNFEQLNDAFERNNLGYLNEYLPHTSFGVDNKIKEWTIQNLTKIIKAYCQLKNINNPMVVDKNQKTPDEINQIHAQWIEDLNQIFINYRDNFVYAPIGLIKQTFELLAKSGQLNMANFNPKEKYQNIAVKYNKIGRFGHNDEVTTYEPITQNEMKIYSAFNQIISKGDDLKQILTAQLLPNEMPL